MKILIAVPTYHRLFAPTLRDVLALELPSDAQIDLFLPWHGYGDGVADSRDSITAKYNAARDVALSQGYAAMLTVESDMRIPPHALRALWQANADVAYSTYVFRRPPYIWSAMSVMDPESMVGYPLTAVPERARSSWGEVVDVDGVGFGCTLIRRAALDAAPFRIDRSREHPGGGYSHCDWYFALDCLSLGLRQVAHLGVVCGHIGETDLNGQLAHTVLWPDPDAPGLVRCEAFTDEAEGAPC